jgi:hypothetical protein
VAHPFAVAVFKDNLYWDDWKQNSVFSADKDHGVGIVRLQSGLQGLMDLKVGKHLKLTTKVLQVSLVTRQSEATDHHFWIELFAFLGHFLTQEQAKHIFVNSFSSALNFVR